MLTLLNRISVETAKQFSHFRKIPISIDYKKLVKGDVLSYVRKYLNEKPDIVLKYANNGDFLLLIDNYDESEKLRYAHKNLDAFLTSYPNNKIILTTNGKLDELLELKESLLKKWQFTPIYIGSVGVKEFKELASKWFTTKDDEWHDENIKKLIKVFKILRIPRTFFSISLYLWIIEKQDNFKPVNKNYLVNKFLQFILEGLIEEEGQAGSFNFDRKKEILSEIAYEMYCQSNEFESYSLSKIKILDAISNYFKKNQRNFDEISVYELFFEKGIFKKIEPEKEDEEEKISFRFESFFQFFLSFNIDTKKEFKEKVFSKVEILSFIDELEYYSGRNQSNKEILSFSIDLLNESYHDLDSIIDDDTDKYLPKKLLLLDKVEDDEIEPAIKNTRLDEKQADEMYEKQLEKLPVDDSIKIKKRYNYKTDFLRSLELSAKVLKNAENIQDPELINSSLDLIIQKTVKYEIFVQSILFEEIKNATTSKKQILSLSLDLFIALTPLIYQSILYQWLATDFLHLPLKNKIEGYLTSKKENRKNHYEQFLSVFIYVELKLPGYTKLLSQTIKQLENKYLAELYFFKLITIYQKTSSKSNIYPILEDLLNLLLRKSKGYSKDQATKKINSDLETLNKDDDSDQASE